MSRPTEVFFRPNSAMEKAGERETGPGEGEPGTAITDGADAQRADSPPNTSLRKTSSEACYGFASPSVTSEETTSSRPSVGHRDRASGHRYRTHDRARPLVTTP